ncbi:MAG TPA: hypothetical protein ENJ50_05375 [Planctomycetaceae bacterium]|nr:hypothetical protein [Planctomycetaceae bacterium]
MEVAAPTDWLVTEPTSGAQTATVALGQSTADVDFGAKRDGDHRLWQNPNEPSDVNGRDGVTPLDVLLVVIDLNTNGARSLLPVNGAPLPPPFVDVNGDDVVSPKDILEVVSTLTALTSSSGQGEGEGVVWVERPRTAPASPSVSDTIGVSEADVEWREGLRTGGVAASDSDRALGALPAEAREMLMGFEPSWFDVEDAAWGALWEDVTLGWSDAASDEEAG